MQRNAGITVTLSARPPEELPVEVSLFKFIQMTLLDASVMDDPLSICRAWRALEPQVRQLEEALAGSGPPPRRPPERARARHSRTRADGTSGGASPEDCAARPGRPIDDVLRLESLARRFHTYLQAMLPERRTG